MLLVGAGGLGCGALPVLARAADRLAAVRIVDDDVIEASNLHRQVLFGGASGEPKAEVAARWLSARSPRLRVEAVRDRFRVESGPALLDGVDVVIDGSDNFATRFAVNDACVSARVPLVHAAAIRWQGQLFAFDPRLGGPCYRCLFEAPPPPHACGSCLDEGVVGPVVGAVGALSAEAALALLDVHAMDHERSKEQLGVFTVYDGLAGTLRAVRFRRNPRCAACGPLPRRAPAPSPVEERAC